MARLDRKGRKAKWTKARAAEVQYNGRLRSVARQIGAIVRGMSPDGSLRNVTALIKSLTLYADTIEPWAKSVASFMVADVARKDAKMWRTHSKEVGRALRQELTGAPTGEILRQLEEEQVRLIKSLPLSAAERVHTIAMESVVNGQRASELARHLLDTENVTAAKARLIARTETSRAASNLVQARATWAGSDGYIWRTSGDSDVRDSHAEMEGKYVRWSQPPTLDKMRGHAGTLPNCRCFAEPVFPDD